MHSVWTVHTLFITVKFVSQSQQMRTQKKKKQKIWSRKRERGAQTATIFFSKPIQITQRPDPITVGKPLFFESKELAAIPVRK